MVVLLKRGRQGGMPLEFATIQLTRIPTLGDVAWLFSPINGVYGHACSGYLCPTIWELCYSSACNRLP